MRCLALHIPWTIKKFVLYYFVFEKVSRKTRFKETFSQHLFFLKSLAKSYLATLAESMMIPFLFSSALESSWSKNSTRALKLQSLSYINPPLWIMDNNNEHPVQRQYRNEYGFSVCVSFYVSFVYFFSLFHFHFLSFIFYPEHFDAENREIED